MCVCECVSVNSPSKAERTVGGVAPLLVCLHVSHSSFSIFFKRRVSLLIFYE